MYRKKVYLSRWMYIRMFVWLEGKDDLWLVSRKWCKGKYICRLYLYWKDISISTIAHECNHIARLLQDKMNMWKNWDKNNIKVNNIIKRLYHVTLWNLPDPSDYYWEMRAYTTGEITESVYRELCKLQKKHSDIRIWYRKSCN